MLPEDPARIPVKFENQAVRVPAVNLDVSW